MIESKFFSNLKCFISTLKVFKNSEVFDDGLLNYLKHDFNPDVQIFNVNSSNIPGFSIEELQLVRSFLKKINRPEDCKALIQKAMKYRDLSIRHPLNACDAFLMYSLLSHSNCNFICFSSDTDVFYIVQNASFADGIYFPSKNICLTFGAVYPADFRGLFSQVLLNYNQLKFLDFSDFAGLCVSHNRPYHYYYNKITALVDIMEEIDSSAISLFSISGANFFNLKHLYDDSSYIEGDVSSLNKLLLSRKSYVFSIGYKHGNVSSKLQKSVTAVVVSASTSNAYLHSLNRSTFLAKKFVIWIGVTGQKRTWIEQIEGISKLIEELLLRYGNDLFVVFDGWTSPLTKSNVDIRESINDNNIVEQIVSKVVKPFNYQIVIGKKSEEKIRVASFCDFFVSGWGSAGIHISRFCNKRGVSHFNNKLAKVGVLDPNGVLIPSEYVTDLEAPSNALSDAYISYSIDPDRFVDFCVNTMFTGAG